MTYICPVCVYPGLDEPPADYTICPCCGTEFEYDDCPRPGQTQEARWIELRRDWLAAGARWFDPHYAAPAGLGIFILGKGEA